jgi:CheY-like chemotaxis protein
MPACEALAGCIRNLLAVSADSRPRDLLVCTVIADGRQAVELAAAHRPDIALIDIQMKPGECASWALAVLARRR